MEFAIAIFVGIWISAAGLLAYHRISKDFADTDNSGTKENKGGNKR